MEKAYKNISYLFAGILLLVFIAFFKTYFGLFPRFTGISGLLHIHTITILLWFALLIVQPILIVRKEVGLHRLLGLFSYGLVPVMVILLLAVMRTGQQHIKHLGIFLVNIFDTSLFVLFYALAIYYRRKPAYHGRFMMLTFLPFLDPAFGRLPQLTVPAGLIQMAIIMGFLFYERFHRRLYKPYLIALAIVFVLYASLMSLYVFGLPYVNALWDLCFA